MSLSPDKLAALEKSRKHIERALKDPKCRACGCFHNTMKRLESGLDEGAELLSPLLAEARTHILEMETDCRGCQTCYPPAALRILTAAGLLSEEEEPTCFSDKVARRKNWPPLPGTYTLLRYQGPVAVCTLTDADLTERLAAGRPSEISLVGTMQTENLGIERLLRNICSNPHLRFLIVCGKDSRQTVGHLPGQSLIALHRYGRDGKNRIINARGQRPFLHNLSEKVEQHFRKHVELLDLIGQDDMQKILKEVKACARRSPGPAPTLEESTSIRPMAGTLPKHMIPDPAGFFVIDLNFRQKLLHLEHYRNDGILNAIIEGHSAAEIYHRAIAEKLISRLDHAAYIGKELGRAERALTTGAEYVQEAAPEDSSSLNRP
jgi:tetrahydromethanopterin S-methyltransferase subunit A